MIDGVVIPVASELHLSSSCLHVQRPFVVARVEWMLDKVDFGEL